MIGSIFKGKRIDNGNWVYGCFLWIRGKAYITRETVNGIISMYVDPNTVCRYTGLKDKNGNRIWENDICDRKEPYPEIVKMHNGDWTLDYSYSCGKDYGYCYCNLGFYAVERKEVEVIGNIFDNTELIAERRKDE